MTKTLLSFCCMILAITSSLRASDTFVDYQNYNHGYCPTCHCYPCQCGDETEEDEEEEEVVGAVDVPEEAEEEVAEKAACEPAVVCATNCGISLWWIGLIIAGVATAGAIIVSSNNGHVPSR